ncbi:hypothetical protein [Rudanella lutea]|uniref:hypothetical protein n=1 Tax=Rudanella lutea TaxID=451374 RepID=UPI0004852C60|nr:hypothetical protein [Rudanella lutea]
MRTGTFFVRAWRIISVLGLVFILINSYISYPSQVAVMFNSAGLATQYLDRETLFYAAVAIFLINNVLINSIARLIPKLPTEKIPVAAAWASHRDSLNEVLVNWFYALMAAVNTILALSLFVLSMLNRSDFQVDGYTYGWLLPLSVFILASVIIALPIRLILMKPSSNNEFA